MRILPAIVLAIGGLMGGYSLWPLSQFTPILSSDISVLIIGTYFVASLVAAFWLLFKQPRSYYLAASLFALQIPHFQLLGFQFGFIYLIKMVFGFSSELTFVAEVYFGNVSARAGFGYPGSSWLALNLAPLIFIALLVFDKQGPWEKEPNVSSNSNTRNTRSG